MQSMLFFLVICMSISFHLLCDSLLINGYKKQSTILMAIAPHKRPRTQNVPGNLFVDEGKARQILSYPCFSVCVFVCCVFFTVHLYYYIFIGLQVWPSASVSCSSINGFGVLC